MKKLFLLLALPLMSGCGGDAESNVVVGLVGALSGSSTPGSMMIQNAVKQRELAKLDLQQKLDTISSEVQAMSSSELELMSTCDSFGSIDDEFTGASCTFSDCTFDSSTLAFTMACTGIDQDVSCGSDTYTLSNFSYSTSVNMSLANNTVTFSMDMEGDLSGAASGALDCNLGFTVDENSSQDFGCEDTNFSCTLGGTAISCSSFESNASSMSCQ